MTNSGCSAAAVTFWGKVAKNNSSNEEESGVDTVMWKETLSVENWSEQRKKSCRSRRVVVSALGNNNVAGADHVATSTSTAVD